MDREQSTSTPRVALAHDWLCGLRGGELVLDAIVRALSSRFRVDTVYTMFDDGQPLTPAIDTLRRIAPGLSRIPGAPSRLRRWMLPLYPAMVESLARRVAADHRSDPFSLLVSTSSAAIKGLRPPPGVPHLCYCHSPARYVWGRRDEYRSAGIASLGLRLYSERFREWDRRTASNVTRFLANSAYTATQIRAGYGRDADVVHPPVRTGFFTPDPSVEREDFWVIVSALEPYKRLDLAIEAAAIAGVRLIVAGTGSQECLLRRAAPAGVDFLGRVDDFRLRDLYRRARLLLFPQIEDFGIVAVEAQACGCPVVARRAGGALETVIDGTTGVFFDAPTPADVAAAAARLTHARPDACRRNAERFNEAAFENAILEAVQTTRADASQSVATANRSPGYERSERSSAGPNRSPDAPATHRR